MYSFFFSIFFQVHRAVIAPRHASVSAEEGDEKGGRGERGGVDRGVGAREGRETVRGEGRWGGWGGGVHALGGRKEIDIAVKIVHPGVHTAACADVQVLRLLSRLVG
jgi:predicted unusual protein kinase regulating ubiquinone biosynthesis (AarF/ABC1/UbiB family)